MRETIANMILALITLVFIAFPICIMYIGCTGTSVRRRKRKRGRR